jgi:hypothetical protein
MIRCEGKRKVVNWPDLDFVSRHPPETLMEAPGVLKERHVCPLERADVGRVMISYARFEGAPPPVCQILVDSRLGESKWSFLIVGPVRTRDRTNLLAEVKNDTVTYRMTSRLGSAVGARTATGGLNGTQDYAPFCELFNGVGIADHFKFTGKKYDARRSAASNAAPSDG